MRALTRSLGRLALGLIAILSITLLLCWVAFPWFASPLAERMLAGTGWELQRLQTGRPGFDGIRIETLELTGPGARIRAGSLRADWTPALRSGPGLPGLADGRIDAVDVAHLRIEHRIPSSMPGAPESNGSDPAAGPGPATGPWLPSVLLRQLPLTRLSLPDVRIRVSGPDDSANTRLALSGRFELDLAGAQLLARMKGALLPTPMDLALELDTDDRIRLRLATAQGEALATAEARLRPRRTGLEVEGHLRLEPGATATVPLESLPEISGALEGRLIVDDGTVRLEVAPGTRIEAHLPTGPDQSAVLTALPDAPFAIRLDGNRIRSTGTLPLTLKADGAIRARAGLRISELDATPGAARATLEADGRIEDDAADFFAEGSLQLGLIREADDRLRIEPEGRIELSRLGRIREDGWQLTRLRLENRTPVVLDPTRRRLLPATLDLSAGALHRAGRHGALPATPLRIRAERDDAGARLELEWDTPELALKAAVHHRPEQAETAVILNHLQLALGPTAPVARLAGLVPDLLPTEGWPLRRGQLQLEGRLAWPPEPDSGAELSLSLEDAGLRSGPLDLDGLALAARWRGGRTRGRLEEIDLALATAEYRPDPAAEPWRAAGIDAGAALQVRAAEASTLHEAMPELALEQLELDLRRAVIAGVGVDRIRLQGTASRSAAATRADLRLAAGALDAGVPMTDVACGLRLDADRVDLDDCSVALLGGEFRAPRGHYDWSTGYGAIPIAIIGLDLGAVLALMQDSSLTGTGTLDGAVPLRLDGTPPAPTITDGFVAARPPGGRLRYAAAPALLERLNQPGLELALSALGDFRYDSLRADVDYAEDGTLDLGITLKGASPRVKSGRPIHFNLDVSQNLPRLLQSLRLSQNIGESLERRLQERFAPDDDGPP